MDFQDCHRNVSFFQRARLMQACALAVVLTALGGMPATQRHASATAPEPVSQIRGVAGDMWADVELGRRDFGEISPREVVPYKVSAPGGVVIDRRVSPGRLYVWDSGNSRILGLDLAACYAQPGPCSASLVIGQPATGDYGACNGDASVDLWPGRAPASDHSLCGMPEGTSTTLEDKSFVGLALDDDGNLYVPDFHNHRVLRFDRPFETDTKADWVLGQVDFAGNMCNRGPADLAAPRPTPHADTLCFLSTGGGGAAVAFDPAGNLWVADGGNNRVLRFPRDPQTGQPVASADLVLGQPDFEHGGDWSYGDQLDRLHSPQALAFDPHGRLFVGDPGNQRVVVFAPPFHSGMPATKRFAADVTAPVGLLADDARGGVWIYEHDNGKLALFDWMTGGRLLTAPMVGQNGGGGIDLDALGHVLVSAYVYGQDVYRYDEPAPGRMVFTRQLFAPPGGYNQSSLRRFEADSLGGVAVVGNQLVVDDGRLLFWNDRTTLVNGQSPDGAVGASVDHPDPNVRYNRLKPDAAGRLWTYESGFPGRAVAFQAPLTEASHPVATVGPDVPLLGGGKVHLGVVHGLAISPDSAYLWLSQPDEHRVLRIRNPLTQPLVDVILGQRRVPGEGCNRGVVPPPNSGTALRADLDMLCDPGGLGFDIHGNLYVSDHTVEVAGNWRLLMFAATTFPARPTQVMFAPLATKSFPTGDQGNPHHHLTWEPVFDHLNHMVVGVSPWMGRFTEYYLDPTRVNPTDPADPTYAIPDGHLNDYYGWATAAAFDDADDLYLFDGNRGRLMIYRQPLVDATTERTWRIEAEPVCPAGATITLEPARLMVAVGPEVAPAWQPTVTKRDGHVRLARSQHASDAVFVGLQTASGQWLPPHDPFPDPAIRRDTSLLPGGTVARWDRGSVADGTVHLRFRAPDTWCAGAHDETPVRPPVRLPTHVWVPWAGR